MGIRSVLMRWGVLALTVPAGTGLLGLQPPPGVPDRVWAALALGLAPIGLVWAGQRPRRRAGMSVAWLASMALLAGGVSPVADDAAAQPARETKPASRKQTSPKQASPRPSSTRSASRRSARRRGTSPPTSTCVPQAITVRVRVVTFNTHRSLGPGGLAAASAEIAALQPDIVLLQEVDRFYARTGHVDQAASLASGLGMEYAFGANVVQGSGQYGTAILSRFPILGSNNVRLPNAPGGEQRGLLGATVEIGGRYVDVFTTHLQNKMTTLRETQARYVGSALAGGTRPTILGGDMNATENTPTLAALKGRLVDSWPAVGVGPAGTGPGGSRIDFLLASPELTPVRSQVYRSTVSDHERVATDYLMSGTTACTS